MTESPAFATVAPGVATGKPVVLREPLSFWGGYDASSGVVIDPSHPQRGTCLAGAVLLMAKAKGSSSSSSVLAEAIRAGTAPAAIVMRERDLIVALGSLVASELYGAHMPVVVASDDAWTQLAELADRFELIVEAGELDAAVRPISSAA